MIINNKSTFLALVLFSFSLQISYGGPPFSTDDPQPVDFKHWEFYISSVSTFHPDIWSGTSPHLEVNYGLIPDLQVTFCYQ